MVICGEAKGQQRFRSPIVIRGVENHVSGVGFVTRGASVTEAHPVVEVDKLGPGKPTALVFKEICHPVVRHCK